MNTAAPSSSADAAASAGKIRLWLAASPVASVGAAAIIGEAGLAMFRQPLWQAECITAVLISIGVGLIAVLPLMLLINHEPTLLLRCAMFANMARLLGVVLGASAAVFIGPQSLHRMVLIGWMSGFYLALLLAETLTSSWAIKQAAQRRGYKTTNNGVAVDAAPRMG